MGPLLEPVGPLGAGTYWRRRLVLIAVLIVLLWLLTRLGGDDGSASADDSPVSVTEPGVSTLGPTPSPSPAPGDPAGVVPPTGGPADEPATDATVSPTAAAKPAQGLQPCSDAALALTVTADTARYAPEAKPVLKLAVGTSEPAPCTRDLGPAALGVVITSGQDRIWGSQDCSTAPTDVRVVTPGTPVTLEMTWDRVRSQPGCPPAGAPARPGYYVVTPVAGKLTGQQTSFLLD